MLIMRLVDFKVLFLFYLIICVFKFMKKVWIYYYFNYICIRGIGYYLCMEFCLMIFGFYINV